MSQASGGGDPLGFLDQGGSRESPRAPEAAEARRHRKMVRLYGGIFGFLVFYVLAGLAWNVAWLARQRVPELVLVLHAPGTGASASYGARVRWNSDSPPGPHPKLLLDGQLVPEEVGGRAPSFSVSSDQTMTLRISLTASVAVGTHSGELLLSGGDGSHAVAALQRAVPVSVEVIGGFWSGSWRLFRLWLGSGFVMLALVYAACLLLFPRPRGVLVLRRDATDVASRSVELRPPPVALLLPFLRSTIPFSRIAALSGWPEIGRYPAELRFLDSRTPLICSQLRREDVRLESALGAGHDLGSAPARRFSPASTVAWLTATVVYRVTIPSAGVSFLFTYKPH